MKAITLRQPWASFVAIGAKEYETRSWSTSYRGPVAIHATQHVSTECWWLCATEPINTLLREGGYAPNQYHWRGCLPTGCIIAVADLVDVQRIVDAAPIFGPPNGSYLMVRRVSFQEQALGDWSPGRFAWRLANVRRVSPIPCSGAQRLWEVPAEVEAQVREGGEGHE